MQTQTAASATGFDEVESTTRYDTEVATGARSAAGAGSLSLPAAGYAWRELQKGLWVVRSEGRHVGIIEGGRRFSITDVHETTTKGFPTFAHALDALAGQVDTAEVGPSSGRSRSSALRSSALAGALGVGLGSIGLVFLH